MKRWAFLLLFLSACFSVHTITKDAYVRETTEYIYAVATAPVPTEVTNRTQALSLARDAAVTLGQTSLLTYILSKKTKSHKTLAEAELP